MSDLFSAAESIDLSRDRDTLGGLLHPLKQVNSPSTCLNVSGSCAQLFLNVQAEENGGKKSPKVLVQKDKHVISAAWYKRVHTSTAEQACFCFTLQFYLVLTVKCIYFFTVSIVCWSRFVYRSRLWHWLWSQLAFASGFPPPALLRSAPVAAELQPGTQAGRRARRDAPAWTSVSEQPELLFLWLPHRLSQEVSF